jgi:segregation and condensation protein A
LTLSIGLGIFAARESPVWESTYAIKLDSFEGPFDLLLQVVEKEKVDIFEVPLAKITDEYLAALDEMKRHNLDIGGDFLVVAAQLAYLKSRLLLPASPSAEGEPSAEDLKTDFLARLAAYKAYQEAARTLGGRDLLGRDVFVRGAAGAEEPPPPELAVELFSLLEAFDAVLQRAKIKVPHEVVMHRLSLAERVNQVVDRLTARGRLLFESLFDEDADRDSVIVTFLAILELAKLRLLRLSVEEDRTHFWVALHEEKAAHAAKEARAAFQHS